jgi:hypothetical protein
MEFLRGFVRSRHRSVKSVTHIKQAASVTERLTFGISPP